MLRVECLDCPISIVDIGTFIDAIQQVSSAFNLLLLGLELSNINISAKISMLFSKNHKLISFRKYFCASYMSTCFSFVALLRGT